MPAKVYQKYMKQYSIIQRAKPEVLLNIAECISDKTQATGMI